MAEQRRVLIISYYWPPSGGAGVQRWLKFAKYLPQNGWTPVVYTPSNPEYPSTDESLAKDIPPEAEVITRDILEPYGAYRKLVGAGKDEKINTGFLSESARPKRTEALSRWLRGNFFIPDARKWWIKPSIKFLTAYLKEHPVDAIISTGPPHSMHRIALGVKKATGLPWIADFRDPWTDIDFYHELHLSKRADRVHKRMEREVLQAADTVLGAWPAMPALFEAKAKIQRMEVITNGYDPADFPEGVVALDQAFTIAHVGSFSPARNPKALWQALASLIEEQPAFAQHLRIKLAGKVDFSVQQDIEAHGLQDHLDRSEYLPHKEVASFQASSQLLLLVANQAPTASSIIPGKVFEYLAAARPIIALCPPSGDLAAIVEQANAGSAFGYTDVEGLKTHIEQAFTAFLSSGIPAPKSLRKQYARDVQTERLAVILHEMVG